MTSSPALSRRTRPVPAITGGRGGSLRRARGSLRSSNSAPGRLARTVIALILCTLALWGALEFALSGAHSAVSEAESGAMPAIVDTSQVAYYLADADRVAATSFVSGTVRLGGPGQRYQDDLKSAHQALARAAEHDATGADGSGQLQSIEGLLVEYTSLVEQAHANEGQGALGISYLSYASGLMHQKDDGILAHVQRLGAAEQQALARQRSTWWLTPSVLLGVLAPGAIALILLIRTQRYLRRHFHRRINPCLLAASVLLVALGGWTTVATLHTDRAFNTACDTVLPRLTASWQARTLIARAAGSDTQAVLLTLPGQPFSSGFADYTRPLAEPAVSSQMLIAARSGPPSLHGVLADLLQADLALDPADNSGKRKAALDTLEHFQRFTAAHAQVQQQADQRDPALVSTAVGPGGTQLGGAEAAVDGDLALRTDLDRQKLAEAADSARSGLGTGPAIPVLGAALAVLCLCGLWPRIDEYRAAR
ncbi:hypothetical protein QMK19_18310 [Streptomyces sp. H10-C2]|uniref:hypothetical protein n=1 Tax=unclassified Streptomyces TaxID=2593676 RepID=UPI0024B8D149|nr:MULTISPECIES: hypothetical protein [unclassified Streptomyces]MDJ0343504.1 hypothetical protein [Streptomyces sp. PH10-H1]MDJ0371584.1 hypothetical protein [Streptomyces sp. H10-C2]